MKLLSPLQPESLSEGGNVTTPLQQQQQMPGIGRSNLSDQAVR